MRPLTLLLLGFYSLLSCCLLMSLQSVTSKRFDASVRTMVTSLGAS